ncbi:MAG: endonuclease/exonuclease/phosphatase family protein [Thiohalomonadales bacterium]
MELNIAVYNMEWMSRLFDKSGNLKTDAESKERLEHLAEVVRLIDPDILGIVEGPDTTKDGSKTASAQVKKWANQYGLAADYEAVHGFPSRGTQEIVALYKSSKVLLTHKPTVSQRKNPFDQPFVVDTNEELVKEQYQHWRPPLELSVKPAAGGDEIARIIVAHAKSKGIFDRVDFARYEQLSKRNRRKLYAECTSIRERCDQWLRDKPERHVIVMGDINDGFGKDYYEQRFSRSAVELLLGEVWYPELILKSVILEKPKVGKYGWTPSTTRFTDKVTNDTLNVLIDHIMVSQGITILDTTVWNPYDDLKPESKDQRVKGIKAHLKKASDHFPVSVKITL